MTITHYAIVERFGNLSRAIPMTEGDVTRQAIATARLRGEGCGHDFMSDAQDIMAEMQAGTWSRTFPGRGRQAVIRAI